MAKRKSVHLMLKTTLKAIVAGKTKATAKLVSEAKKELKKRK